MFLFFSNLALGTLVALVLGLSLGHRRLANLETLSAFVQRGVVAGFVTVGLVAWVRFLFDSNVAKPIDILSGALRARAHSDVT